MKEVKSEEATPETTPEQAAALKKAFDTGAAEAKATRECPNCGIPNPINRITCEICGGRIDAYKQATKKGGGTVDEIKKELFESNKRLRNARAAGDSKLESNVLKKIKGQVTKSKGVFVVGPNGEAVQAKSTKEKVAKIPRVKKEKKTHICPDCGEATNGGSYFKMGHDGRTHGMLIKLSLDKMKKNEVKSGVLKLLDVWLKSGKKLSMKECAQKVAGE